MHFKPMSLTIEISGFPNICRPCLEVIEHVAFESGHVFVAADEMAGRTRQALQDIRDELDRIDEAYAEP
jgi:hypothetical protein